MASRRGRGSPECPGRHGHRRTRSYRSDYLDVTYARLAHEAFRLWCAFEEETASEVLVRCGCMNIAKRSVTPNLAGTYAQMSHDTLTRLGMRTAALDGVALRRRFPFLDADLARIDLDGGVVDVPAVTRALTDALRVRGVAVLEGVVPSAIERDGARLRVLTGWGSWEPARWW